MLLRLVLPNFIPYALKGRLFKMKFFYIFIHLKLQKHKRTTLKYSFFDCLFSFLYF